MVIGGLTPGLSYDLAVYGNGNSHSLASISVRTTATTVVTKYFPFHLVSDWSALTEGTQYLLFHPVATAGGTVTFDPREPWSAFQIQPTAVPEPAEYAALTGLALAGFALWRRRSAK